MINYSRITKVLLIFLLSVFSLSPSYAQDYYGSSYSQKNISLGITFSPNISWLRYGYDADVNKVSKISYGYGLLADFAFSENYYFSSGFLINNLKSSVRAVADQISTTYNFQYIEVPLALKLKSTQRYFRSYYGQFGFTGGVKLNGDQALDNGEKENLNMNTFRLALQVGGGIEWQLDHNMSMMTGLSLNNGFTEVLGKSYGNPKNSYLAFNFAIFF